MSSYEECQQAKRGVMILMKELLSLLLVKLDRLVASFAGHLASSFWPANIGLYYLYD